MRYIECKCNLLDMMSMESDVNWVFDSLVILSLLVFSGFFSGSETALTAVSRARLYRLAAEGDKRARTVMHLRNIKEELIGAILLGNNLVNIAATALATSLAIALFGDDGVAIVTIVLTLLILVFAEVLPKTFAIRHSEKAALAVAPVIAVLVRLLLPITRAVHWFIGKTLKLFGVDLNADDAYVEASEVIRGTIEMHHNDGQMVKQDRDMLGSILDLSNIEVGDILVHRKSIDTIDASADIKEIVQLALNSPHSRIPFWKDDPDNIIGLLHAKDLTRVVAETGVKGVTHDLMMEILREPWFIPETTTLREQLMAFRAEERHFAHVIDEYGDFQGIITLEDIIEEIVGEIRDEDDEPQEQEPIMPHKKGGFTIWGSATIRDINRELDWKLPDEHAATVAGLVMHESRSIPEKGAKFVFYGFTFEILDKRENQITSVRVRKL